MVVDHPGEQQLKVEYSWLAEYQHFEDSGQDRKRLAAVQRLAFD